MNIIRFAIWLCSKFSECFKMNYIQNVRSSVVTIFKIISSLINNIIIICPQNY